MTVVTDKPSHLQDGTPAREVELHAVNGVPFNWLCLAAKKGDDVIVHVDIDIAKREDRRGSEGHSRTLSDSSPIRTNR